MVRDGDGTPFPLDHTSKLVMSGHDRYVRNPMAIAGIGQCIPKLIIFDLLLYWYTQYRGFRVARWMCDQFRSSNADFVGCQHSATTPHDNAKRARLGLRVLFNVQICCRWLVIVVVITQDILFLF